MNIVEKINELRSAENQIDAEYDVLAKDVLESILNLLAEICLAETKQEATLSLFERNFWESFCREFGHKWTYDHCGYWHHQYCSRCRRPKHAELWKFTCTEFSETFGNLTEEQYLRGQGDNVKHDIESAISSILKGGAMLTIVVSSSPTSPDMVVVSKGEKAFDFHGIWQNSVIEAAERINNSS